MENHTITIRPDAKQNTTTIKPPVNFEVEEHGVLVLATHAHIVGSGSPALRLEGEVHNVQHLVLGQEVSAFFTATGRIIADISVAPEAAPPRTAVIELASLVLDAGSLLEIAKDTGTNVVTGSLRVKTGSKITADFMSVKAGSVHTEPGSIFTASGTDRQASNPHEVYDDNLSAEDGGGHGSVGGSGVVSKTFLIKLQFVGFYTSPMLCSTPVLLRLK